ncbi:MAG: hypothetical protein HY741_15450 [Chloroflexi bacterium]|nr:hypothetical protein [Chloroflexota bacterium]
MFERILNQFQEKVRKRQYVMTLHAEEEMNDAGLTIFDVEHAILTGKMSPTGKMVILTVYVE